LKGDEKGEQCSKRNYLCTHNSPRPPSNKTTTLSRYDADKSGAIELPELTAALSDLGLLDGKAPAEAAAIAEGHMRAAGGGPLSPGAFGRWAATLLEGKARQQLRFKMGVQAEGVCACVCGGVF
jgi:hypothetical protein